MDGLGGEKDEGPWCKIQNTPIKYYVIKRSRERGGASPQGKHQVKKMGLVKTNAQTEATFILAFPQRGRKRYFSGY